MTAAAGDWAALLLGVGLAGIGGQLFVRGALALGVWARLSAGVIGATIAAVATSSPELAVAINAGLAGEPDIALGDSLGSNVVNLGLVLAIGMLASGLRVDRRSVRHDLLVALLTQALIGVMCFDGLLSRADAALLLAVFAAWLVAAIRRSRREDQPLPASDGTGPLTVLALCAFGLTLLFAAGHLVVQGARAIALSFGVADFIVGATVVALGTSIPELATVIAARLRRRDAVGLGTVLGSNIFNGLVVVSVAALMHPIVVEPANIAPALLSGFVLVSLALPSPAGLLSPARALLLLAVYAAYLGVTAARAA